MCGVFSCVFCKIQLNVGKHIIYHTWILTWQICNTRRLLLRLSCFTKPSTASLGWNQKFGNVQLHKLDSTKTRTKETNGIPSKRSVNNKEHLCAWRWARYTKKTIIIWTIHIYIHNVSIDLPIYLSLQNYDLKSIEKWNKFLCIQLGLSPFPVIVSNHFLFRILKILFPSWGSDYYWEGGQPNEFPHWINRKYIFNQGPFSRQLY